MARINIRPIPLAWREHEAGVLPGPSPQQMVFDGVPTPRDLERARKRFALLDRASQQWYAFNFSKWFADLPLSDR